MSLFLVGFIAGIALMSILTWRRIVRPMRKLSRNLSSYQETGQFGFIHDQKHPEVQKLQHAVTQLLLELNQHRKSNKNLLQLKQEFLGLVSHELRTPLTSIKGSLNLLSTGVVGELNPRSQGFVQIAESEVDRMILLVNDLLDFAKLESGTLPLNKEWVQLEPLFEETRQALTGLQQKTDVGIIIEPLDQKLDIYADPNRLKQLLINYLSNGIAHSEKKGYVTLGAVVKDGQLRIHVYDQGAGISIPNQRRIFEKFVRVEEDGHSGTGLGLAICRAIAEAHGGQVGVESDIGMGSLFYFETEDYRISQTQQDQAA